MSSDQITTFPSMSNCTLSLIDRYLENSSDITDSEFEQGIAFLSLLLSSGSQSSATWQELKQIVQKHPLIQSLDIEDDILRPEMLRLVYYFRLLRGVVMVIRNEAPTVTSQESAEMVSILIKSLSNFIILYKSDGDLYEKTVTVYLQALANFREYAPSKDLVSTLNDIVGHISTQQYCQPLIVMLATFFRDGESIDVEHNDSTYELLKIDPESNFILQLALDQFETVDFKEEGRGESDVLNVPETLLVKLCCQVISHESFGIWMWRFKISDPEVISINFSDNIHPGFTRWLRLAQVLVPAHSWNEYQLIPLLAWVLPCYNAFQADTILAITKKNDDTRLQLHIVIILDIISDLCQHNQGKSFFIHYNIVESLIELLRVVHENIKPITLKQRQGLAVEALQHFPHLKSIIIEILSYLAIEQFEIQEKIREFHGLEIILSNCIIDENNPFIKERAILCLRYLLAGNAENQKFVGKLEAVKPTDESVLQDVGYEVKILDGKLVVNKNSTDDTKQ